MKYNILCKTIITFKFEITEYLHRLQDDKIYHCTHIISYGFGSEGCNVKTYTHFTGKIFYALAPLFPNVN